MDEQRHLIRLRNKDTGELRDQTSDVTGCEWVGDKFHVAFASGRTYGYRPGNVDVRSGSPEPVPPASVVVVEGEIWRSVTSITRFGDHTRITRGAHGSLKHSLRASADVSVIEGAAQHGLGYDVVAYWRALAGSLAADDPTRQAVERLRFIDPRSALATYLCGEPIGVVPNPVPAIYPFRSNISQRQAVDQALSRPLSVIEGPPGTGKTQTILNIVASVVAAGDLRVAVVSSTNSAVDNVREKLEKDDVGFITAALGNKANQESFLAKQQSRNEAVDAAMNLAPPAEPRSAQALADLTNRLRRAQEWDRDRARLEAEIAAYRLEHRHFAEHLDNREVPDLDTLPLLRKAPEKILDYLIETHLDNGPPGLLTRVRRYFTYGRTRDIDPNDAQVVLRLQERYYTRRIADLEARLARLVHQLEKAGLDGLITQHSLESRAVLDQALRERYSRSRRRIYSGQPWAREREFLTDYPVILSTCHSLARNLPDGRLVDLLIIDESSQVSLLVAAVAMACAKQVVVVGDTRQLPHIPGKLADAAPAPHPAYDHREHNLLSSLHALYGNALPSTMLIEHYRCAPEIIGFCNRAFYDGRLVNFTRRESTDTPMHLWTTSEGNHMRRLKDGGGISNQREIDIIRKEVIPAYGLEGRQVGYIAPYRLQADELASLIDGTADTGALIDASVPATRATTTDDTAHSHANTTHGAQGREWDVVVLSAVVDNSWRGQYALKSFVDDARLINVAVSRAMNEFILVTHHDRNPTSRNLADLANYIEYHDPDAVHASNVLSIFDLLYKDYSARLAPFAARVHGPSKYLSENATGTLLDEILSTDEHERYAGLGVVPQYRLSHLFSDLGPFTPEQRRFIGTTSSVDFLIYRTVSLRPVLAVEVDGGSHRDDPRQIVRDEMKDRIFERAGLPLERLPTTGSDEETHLTRALDAAVERAPVLPDSIRHRPSASARRASHDRREGTPGAGRAAERPSTATASHAPLDGHRNA